MAKKPPVEPVGDLPSKDVILAATMKNLQERMKRGENLRAEELRFLDSYLEGNGPGALRGEPEELQEGEPADILCRDQKHLAVVAGIHENTVGKWKREGLADPGAKPISLRAYFLLLRRRGKLAECKPPQAKARELLRWVFGGAGEPSYNPDDPSHPPPESWAGEKDRQGALKGKTDRQMAEVELETLNKERIPVAVVSERLRKLAAEVRATLTDFMSVASAVKDLTPKQRIAVSEAIAAQITKAQTALAKVGVA